MIQTDDGLKSGLNQTDMYQIVSYVISRNCNDVLLLYPRTLKGNNTSTLFDIQSKMLLNELHISVENIDITFNDIKEADALLKERVKKLHHIFD